MDNFNLSNTQLYQQIQRISKLKSIRRRLSGYQAILEYINVYCLTQLFHVKMDNYSIINIIEQYGNYDDHLYDMMLSINADYDKWSEKGIEETNLELFLYRIQNIYETIKTNYGDIILDDTLEFCQTYYQYIQYLEKEEQCTLSLKQFMNYNPQDHWYTYMEIVALIYQTFEKYAKLYSWQDKVDYIDQMLETIQAYYEKDS